jgi:hypothetical protein
MAADPRDLRFCIGWQHSPEDSWDNLDEFQSDTRFDIIDIPHQESKGACWARHQIQQRYHGEDYYLQLDSHHRFSRHWDGPPLSPAPVPVLAVPGAAGAKANS